MQWTEYVQDQLFYSFLAGDSPACASYGYTTKTYFISWMERAYIVVFGFCQKPSHRGALFAKYFSRQATGQRTSAACCCFELKVTWFHHELVFTASLFEVENGVKPCRIYKAFRSIQAKLTCCIESPMVFARNWSLLVCERNQPLSRKIFQRCIQSFVCRLEYFTPNNGKRPSLRGTR